MSILAIDFGGTRTRAGWYDQDLRLHVRHETPSLVHHDAATVIGRLIDTARRVVPSGAPVKAIGIAAPGPLDAPAGLIRHAATLPGWRDVPLARLVGEAFGGVPVVMENDANLAALAEYHAGAARGADPAIYLTISTGMGGGAVIGGALFTGWSGLAIEPGHLRFPLPDGRLCRLEELVSGTGLAQRAQQRLAAGAEPSSLRAAEAVDGRAVGEAARQGDPLALEIVAEAGRWLGLGLVALIHLFSPRAIVLGGSVATLGDLLFEPARRVVAANLIDPQLAPPDLLRPAQLGDDVCLLGAALYARRAAGQ